MRTLQETLLAAVGYEGRTAAEVVSVVAEARVDVLADVCDTEGQQQRCFHCCTARRAYCGAIGGQSAGSVTTRIGDPAR